MKKIFKTLISCAAVTCASLATTAASAAYPEKPITILTPFVAGGTSDVLARLVANHLNRAWGQTAIVVNKPGAGGQIAMQQLSKSAPDGYTLSITSSGTASIGSQLFKRPPYNSLKDFTHISVLVDLPLILAVSQNSPVKDLREFVAKAKSDNGAVSIGVAGTGSHQFLAAQQLSSAGGFKLNVITYKGSPQTTNDLLGGAIDSVMDNVTSQLPLIQAKSVKPLAVSSEKRIAVLPDVPTFAEAGVPHFNSVAWFGLAAPAGTPADVVNKIQQELAKFFKEPTTRQQLEKQGMVVVVSTSEEATHRVAREFEEFRTIIDRLGLEKQ